MVEINGSETKDIMRSNTHTVFASIHGQIYAHGLPCIKTLLPHCAKSVCLDFEASFKCVLMRARSVLAFRQHHMHLSCVKYVLYTVQLEC